MVARIHKTSEFVIGLMLTMFAIFGLPAILIFYTNAVYDGWFVFGFAVVIICLFFGIVALKDALGVRCLCSEW